MNLKTNPNDSIFMDGNGMTKREFFAAVILNGTAVNSDGDGRADAEYAVELADILIESLNAVKNDVLEK